MIPQIAKLYNSGILKEAERLFGFEHEFTKDIGGFESHVFECGKDEHTYILKITHTIRRSPGYLLGEIDYVNHLARGGANVQAYIQSVTGNLIEEIPGENGTFLAYSYEKAPGEVLEWNHFATKKHWDRKLFKQWGKAAGRIVELSRTYKPDSGIEKRKQWYQESLLWNCDEYLPREQSIVIEKIKRLYEQVKSLPVNDEIYGLAHGDIHHGNFCLDEENMYIFDFDDCEYNFYANEVAIPVTYAALMLDRKKHSEFVPIFMKSFMDGYREETTITVEQTALVPHLMKIRKMLLYVLHYQCMEEKDHGKAVPPWMNVWRKEIENDIPVVDFDVTAF